MGDNNESIEDSPVDTASSIAAPALSPSDSNNPTATFATTSTATSIPSITSSKATSTTAKLISTPAIKLPKKRVRASMVKKDPIAASASFKPPTQKMRRKRAVEGEDPSEKPQLV